MTCSTVNNSLLSCLQHSVPRRSGVSKAALTRHTRVKDEEEEEWREHDSEDDRQPHPPPDKGKHLSCLHIITTAHTHIHTSHLVSPVGVTSDLFPVVEASLPVCPVTKETIHRLWQKQLRQVTTLTKPTPSHPHHDDPHHDDQVNHWHSLRLHMYIRVYSWRENLFPFSCQKWRGTTQHCWEPSRKR